MTRSYAEWCEALEEQCDRDLQELRNNPCEYDRRFKVKDCKIVTSEIGICKDVCLTCGKEWRY